MAHSIGVEIAKPYWTVTDERTKGNYKYTEKTNNYGTRVTRIENTQTGRAKEVTYIEGEPFELAVSEKEETILKPYMDATTKTDGNW